MNAGAWTLVVIVCVFFPPFIPFAIVLAILDARERSKR